MSDIKQTDNTAKKTFVFPAVLWFVFIGMGIFWYRRTGSRFFLFDLPYIGTSIALGIIINTLLPPEKAHYGRRFTQLLVGIYMLFFLGIFLKVNMQIEQFFFLVLTASIGGAIIHYLPAKVLGPLLFSRGWCGWGCWTAMVLDFLPWKQPQQGRIRKAGLVRYLHFAVSLALVAVLIHVVKYTPKPGIQVILWCLIGNLFYYAAALILAALMKDNRAFCKYICPIPVLQKVFSRFSIFKESINHEKCTRCGKCERVCPMDIKLLDYASRGQRILSTECILCGECERACPQKAVSLTAGLDIGLSEYIRFR